LNNTACKYTTHLSLDQYCCQVQEEKRMLASSYIK
jgi:hypothetical protein